MKRFVVKNFFIIATMILLAGCGGKLTDWTAEHFNQGSKVAACSANVACYLKSARIYDKFTLYGSFCVMWLSGVVRSKYANLYAFTHGKNKVEKKAFLSRQLAENDMYNMFYVLNANAITFGDADARWSVYLLVDGNYYSPIEVKVVDLEPEYKLLFGKAFNAFTTAYQVKFRATDTDNNPIITETTRTISLEFRSLCKMFTLCWDVMRGCCVRKEMTCGLR
jgi:hypothetical protein